MQSKNQNKTATASKVALKDLAARKDVKGGAGKTSTTQKNKRGGKIDIGLGGLDGNPKSKGGDSYEVELGESAGGKKP